MLGNWDDPIEMPQVLLVADRLAGGKRHHLSSIVVLEAVNEIIRQRAELKNMREELRKHG